MKKSNPRYNIKICECCSKKFLNAEGYWECKQRDYYYASSFISTTITGIRNLKRRKVLNEITIDECGSRLSNGNPSIIYEINSFLRTSSRIRSESRIRSDIGTKFLLFGNNFSGQYLCIDCFHSSIWCSKCKVYLSENENCKCKYKRCKQCGRVSQSDKRLYIHGIGRLCKNCADKSLFYCEHCSNLFYKKKNQVSFSIKNTKVLRDIVDKKPAIIEKYICPDCIYNHHVYCFKCYTVTPKRLITQRKTKIDKYFIPVKTRKVQEYYSVKTERYRRHETNITHVCVSCMINKQPALYKCNFCYSICTDQGCSCLKSKNNPLTKQLNRIMENYTYKPKPQFQTLNGIEHQDLIEHQLKNSSTEFENGVAMLKQQISRIRLRSQLKKLYLGFELEIENVKRKEINKVTIVRLTKELKKACKIYCKPDASIKHGFEIVSHPATLEWFQTKNMKPIWNLVRYGYRSYNTSTCGMHVHMSGKALSPLHLSNFIDFFMDNKAFIRAISGRREGNFNSWSRFAKRAETIQMKKRKNIGSRNTAVNVTKNRTVEVRIFRGTLKKESFLANLEFCHCVYTFSKSGMKVRNLKEFLQFLTAERLTYPNLYNKIKTAPRLRKWGETLCV